MLSPIYFENRYTGSGHGGDKSIDGCLRSLVIITHAKGALLAQTVGPEALNGGTTGEVVVGHEEPEAKDRLGKNVKHGVGNDFTIDRDVARAISDTPDAKQSQSPRCYDGAGSDIHWVDSPEDESKAPNGSVEGSGLLILGLGSLASVEGDLVDDDEVGNAGHGVPTPLGGLINLESGEEPSEDHDNVSEYSNQDAGTVQAR